MGTWSGNFEGEGQHIWSPANGGEFTISDDPTYGWSMKVPAQSGDAPGLLVGGSSELGGSVTRPRDVEGTPLVISGVVLRNGNLQARFGAVDDARGRGYVLSFETSGSEGQRVVLYYVAGSAYTVIGSAAAIGLAYNQQYEFKAIITASGTPELPAYVIKLDGSEVASGTSPTSIPDADLLMTGFICSGDPNGAFLAVFDYLFLSGDLSDTGAPPDNGGDASIAACMGGASIAARAALEEAQIAAVSLPLNVVVPFTGAVSLNGLKLPRGLPVSGASLGGSQAEAAQLVWTLTGASGGSTTVRGFEGIEFIPEVNTGFPVTGK